MNTHCNFNRCSDFDYIFLDPQKRYYSISTKNFEQFDFTLRNC